VLIKTAGYGNPEIIGDICDAVDAVNVDFKAYDADVYRKITTVEMQPMLDTIRQVARSDVWLELTNLVVPGYNDSDEMVVGMARWIIDNCGASTPLHMSRFFPKYRFRAISPTPRETLLRLRKVAFNTGLKYVYLGNMGGDPAESTYCPKCWLKVIERVGFRVTNKGLDLDTGKCTKCGYRIPGVWV
jgi:pyruvate formate lyase activating enzyme